MSASTNTPPEIHPAVQRTIARHREFFAGERDYLVSVGIPIDLSSELEPQIPFDELVWERDFDAYVRIAVANGKRAAQARLALGVDDDAVSLYFPYFGISIHHSFFGGQVTFANGTSYAEPVIERAAEWERLNPDPQNVWLQRLARGLAYGRDHGAGVLFASYRGGNGPLDMANGVLGNALFTEMFDDPENMHRLMAVCTESIYTTFGVQRAHNSDVEGGRFVPMGGLWVPGEIIGHVSLDAACLAGPALYEAFERPYLEQVAARTGGVIIHTHMLGRKLFREMCATKGIRLFMPADDPNQPTLLDELDSVLAAAGDVPLGITIPRARFGEVLPKLHGRRAAIYTQAASVDEAKQMLEEIDRYCPLQR